MDNKYIYGGLAIIGIIGIIMFVTVDGDPIHRFLLEPMDLTREGILIIPDRICSAKVTNTAIQQTVNRQGLQIEEIASDNSPFFIDHPIFNFISNENNGETFEGFIINPKLKCFSGLGSSIDEPDIVERTLQQQVIEDACIAAINEGRGLLDDPVCDVVSFETLVIKSGELTVQVISENTPSDKKIITFQKTFDTDRTEIPFGTEKEFGEIKILSKDIFDDLDVGNYDSIQEFRVFGTIELAMLAFENNPVIPTWTYVIPQQAIPTFFNVEVNLTENQSSTTDDTTDNNNDGIPDQNASGTQNDTTPDDSENDNTSPISPVGFDILELLGEFGDCLNTEDYDCLNQGKLLIVWVIIFGLIFILFIAIILSLSKRNRY